MRNSEKCNKREKINMIWKMRVTSSESWLMWLAQTLKNDRIDHKQERILSK